MDQPEEQHKIDSLRAYKGQHCIVLYKASKYTGMNMDVVTQMNCQTVGINFCTCIRFCA